MTKFCTQRCNGINWSANAFLKNPKIIFKNSKLRNECEDYLEMKPYLSQMNLRQSMFRARSSMLQVKMNQKSNPAFSAKSWKCDDCLSVDFQSHILWCPAYASLREGKNLYDDMDLVTYYQEVMHIRDEVSKCHENTLVHTGC